MQSQPLPSMHLLHQRLLAMFFGLFLCSGLLVFFLLNISFMLDLRPVLILGGLLYFVWPLVSSFFLSWKTGQRPKGYQAGFLTGCSGTLFFFLIAVVYFVIATLQHPSLGGKPVDKPEGFSLYLPLLAALGSLQLAAWVVATIPGALLGGVLGTWWSGKKRAKRAKT